MATTTVMNRDDVDGDGPCGCHSDDDGGAVDVEWIPYPPLHTPRMDHDCRGDGSDGDVSPWMSMWRRRRWRYSGYNDAECTSAREISVKKNLPTFSPALTHTGVDIMFGRLFLRSSSRKRVVNHN